MAEKDVVFAEVPDLEEQVLYEGEPVRLAISREFLEAMLEASGESHVEVWLSKIYVKTSLGGIRSLLLDFTRDPEAVPPQGKEK